MTVTYAPFDISDYLDNDEVIAEFLTAAAQDDNPDVLLAALSHVAKANRSRAIWISIWLNAVTMVPLTNPAPVRINAMWGNGNFGRGPLSL